MSSNVFLQMTPATVAFFDLRRFSVITRQLGPVDVGVVLTRFYEHIEDAVVGNKGRVVKYFADAAVVLFPATGGRDYAGDALEALDALRAATPEWLQRNAELKLPELDYSVGLATGDVLHGDIGTQRVRTFDVLGEPVTLASKLVRLAKARGAPHLISGGTYHAAREPVPCVETEGAEIAGKRVRLYRLLAPQERAEGGEESGS